MDCYLSSLIYLFALWLLFMLLIVILSFIFRR